MILFHGRSCVVAVNKITVLLITSSNSLRHPAALSLCESDLFLIGLSALSCFCAVAALTWPPHPPNRLTSSPVVVHERVEVAEMLLCATRSERALTCSFSLRYGNDGSDDSERDQHQDGQIYIWGDW